MEYGYIRDYGSSDELNGDLGAQFSALYRYGVSMGDVLVEGVGDSPNQFPKLDELIDSLQAGDVLIVNDMASVAASVHRLARIIDSCMERGAAFVSVEDSLDTRENGEVILSVIKAIANMDRMRFKRMRARSAASDQGRARRGRPRLDESAVEEAVDLYLSRKHSMKEVVDMTGISQATIFRRAQERRKGHTDSLETSASDNVEQS